MFMLEPRADSVMQRYELIDDKHQFQQYTKQGVTIEKRDTVAVLKSSILQAD